LLGTAIVGSVIGIFRHGWLNNPKILLSPKNLPEVVTKSVESGIITVPNQQILIRNEVEKVKSDIVNKPQLRTDNIAIAEIVPASVEKK